jgi:hypothetical protein
MPFQTYSFMFELLVSEVRTIWQTSFAVRMCDLIIEVASLALPASCMWTSDSSSHPASCKW